VTSDLHFGQKYIIESGFRKFENIEEMDKTLIENWNNQVGIDDTVYVLGDFSFHTQEKTQEILRSLNGTKHLIIGNHDNIKNVNWRSITPYKEMYRLGKFIIMSHYPFKCWNGLKQGSIHLHGHIHSQAMYNTSKKYTRRYDVGVDSTNFHLIDLDDIIFYTKQKDAEIGFVRMRKKQA